MRKALLTQLVDFIILVFMILDLFLITMKVSEMQLILITFSIFIGRLMSFSTLSIFFSASLWIFRYFSELSFAKSYFLILSHHTYLTKYMTETHRSSSWQLIPKLVHLHSTKFREQYDG